MFSTDVILESLRALILVFLVLYLWKLGQKKTFSLTSGWGFIKAGSQLILFGALLDVTDNFDSLNSYVIFGTTEVEAFLKNIVGYLCGLILVTIGFVSWGPSVERLITTNSINSQAKEPQSKADERFKNFFDASSDWYWEMGPDLRFTALSGRFEERTGVKSEWIIGRKRSDLVPADVDEEKWRKHLETLNAHDPFKGFEYGMKRKDGKMVYMRISGTPFFDENLKFMGYRGSGTSITKRVLAEQAHSREIRLKNYLLETTQEGYWHIDADGLTVDVNPALCRLVDRPREEIVGQSILNFVDAKYAEFFETEIDDIKQGKMGTYEIHLQRSDGINIPCLVNLTPIPDAGGKPAGVIGMWTDITEQKQLEERLRRSHTMEATGQLTGGIAHDFNNLLGVITGSLQISKDLIEEESDANKWIDKALAGAKRGADLTASLLRFSRRDVENTRVISINPLIREMEELLEKSLTQKIDFQTDLMDDLWLTDITPGKFTDALTNLVINARDAMPQGGRLHITTRNALLGPDHEFTNVNAKPGEFVCLEIFDTGSGIEKNNLDKLFDPLFTTKTQDEGTGLGLSMVYKFILESGGDISVDSVIDYGTTFEVYLPRSTTEQTDQPAKSTVDLSPLSGTESILIVDDEISLMEIAEKHMMKLGYKTKCTSEAEEAHTWLMEDNDFDLLFSDVVMPGGMNGFELARSALNSNANLKVLLTSGFTNQEALEDEGVDFCDETIKRLSTNLLPKPYSQEKLAQNLRRVLDGKIR